MKHLNAGSCKHKTVVHAPCPFRGGECRPAVKLIGTLNEAVDAALALGAVGVDFGFSGAACIDTCCRACRLGFHASVNRSYVFGVDDEDCDIDALVAEAERELSGNGKTACGPTPFRDGPPVLARSERVYSLVN